MVRQLSIVLTLDPAVELVGRLLRESGEPEPLTVKGGNLRLTLPCGIGDLLRWGSDEFPVVSHRSIGSR